MPENFRFIPSPPRLWIGRYRRPMGDESTYHVSSTGKIEVRWKDPDLNLTYYCPVKDSVGVRALAKAVNDLKRQKTGWPGGGFVINEFCQVICPVRGSRDRYLVGEAHGILYFKDKKNESGFVSLCDDSELDCGDDWERPYMGIKYQLHADDHIYFWNEDEEGGRKQYPRRQDRELIEKLREVRPNGPMSFLVNQYGIVVAKKELGRNLWKPVYVGRINYELWFDKEG